MIANGVLYQLHNSELPINESAGSALHIPEESRTADGLLPTPTKSGSEHRTRYSQGGRPLLHMILKGLPTPTACDPEKQSTGGLHRLLITGTKYSKGDHRYLPTPLAEAHHTGENPKYLNPQFVEWMMGFPIDWTDLESDQIKNDCER